MQLQKVAWERIYFRLPTSFCWSALPRAEKAFQNCRRHHQVSRHLLFPTALQDKPLSPLGPFHLQWSVHQVYRYRYLASASPWPYAASLAACLPCHCQIPHPHGSLCPSHHCLNKNKKAHQRRLLGHQLHLSVLCFSLKEWLWADRQTTAQQQSNCSVCKTDLRLRLGKEVCFRHGTGESTLKSTQL